MFEGTAAVAIVALMLISSVAGYLRKAKDPLATQGYWLPIFYFSAGVMVMIIPFSSYEIVGFIAGWMKVCWADDSLMAVVLCFFFFLFSFSVAAFRYVDGEVAREKTPYKNPRAERFRTLGSGLIFMQFFVAFLCLGQYFQLFPRQRFMNFLFDERVVGNVVEINADNISDTVNRFEPFLRFQDKQILSGVGFNCSTPEDCFLSLVNLEEQSAFICNASGIALALVNGMNTIVGPSMAYSVQFGLSDLLQKEILALGVLTIGSIGLLLGSLMYPVLDDVSLVISGVSSAVMSIAVPYRILEMQNPIFQGTIGEWFIPILGLALFLASSMSVMVRIEGPHRFISPFVSEKDLEDAFNLSPYTEVEKFVQQYVEEAQGSSVSEIFAYLKGREQAESQNVLVG